jgi:hypothetical protein
VLAALLASSLSGGPVANAQGWDARARPAAPTAPGGQWETSVPRQAGPGSEAGTTGVPDAARPAGKPAPVDPATLARVELSALLSDEGQAIDRGLVWHIFEAAEGRMTPLRSLKDASPVVDLPPGAYVITATFGRSFLSRRVSVVARERKAEVFVLNAGGLRVQATLASGGPAPDGAVSYDIFTDERDQRGERTRVLTNAKPGLIVRLNAGLYHVVSTYGDANAVVKADIGVEAGKLTEATVKHAGTRIALKLVARPGGDAVAGTRWSIADERGRTVKESMGALPAHVLAPGTYVVTAHNAGRTFRGTVTLAGEATRQFELVMR